ncbi:MAG TPA: M20 family metallopeptidase [Acidimicrobiales bacterium]|nr:M20 family metallopeptidase [Acidimicrobiales bacterium]
MTVALLEELSHLIDEVDADMVELRHDFHRHPELSFEEVRTSEVITDRLRTLGWTIAPSLTATGVVATLQGGRPGARVLLRADIDALPVQEEGDLDYRSVNPGVMHACGHDVHAAALLGVADVLARRQSELSGQFIVVFQPAEERLGGARAMLQGGLLREHPADFALGVHVTSLAPVGLVSASPGITMSEACSFSVTLRGKGGHGAMSTSEGNVVLAISRLAPRLDEVVAGLSYEGTNCACSAGVLKAGTANNVVPREAQLLGTIRTFTPEQATETRARLRRLLDEIAAEFRLEYQLDVGEAVPAVENDPAVTAVALASARAVVGEAGVFSLPPVSPSDDVSEIWREIPGCYFFVGGARSDGTSGMHHGPDFFVEDGSCRVAAHALAHAAITLGAHGA